MTTSSDNRSPSPPSPGGDHWNELSDAVAASMPTMVAELDHWFDRQLAHLEVQQKDFITNRSLRKNLRG